MTARQTICGYLAINAVLGVLSAALSLELASIAQGAWFILSMAVPYVWFYQDAAKRRFARTYPWTRGIILLSLVTVPLYLFKSRPPGQRLKAIAKAAGVFALSVLLPILGAALYATIASMV